MGEMHLSELPTPAMCVDVDVLEANVAEMARFFAGRPCGLRPHVKAHKTPAIASIQSEAGCLGFTCATVHEAEVMARHGFEDLLIANEVLDRTQMPRLQAAAERADVTVAVDSPQGVELLAGTAVAVLVDVNVGLPRCGVAPEAAVDLARLASDAGLVVRGVMGYEGHAMAIEGGGEREAAARQSMSILLETAHRIREAGFDAPVVSAGGTGTYSVTGTIEGVTELQAGSYALMDTTYGRYGLPFREALRCLTTVVSVQGQIAVLDAGLKTLATDHGNPELPEGTSADVFFLSDEHTTLVIRDGFDSKPGSRTWLRPSHVDPTVNLHDRLYAVRGESVVDVWPVEARGYPPAR